MNNTANEEKPTKIALARVLSCKTDELVPFTWRKTGQAIMPEGTSIRYSAIALIGLQAYGVSSNFESNATIIGQSIKTLKSYIHKVKNYGDLGLCLSALAFYRDSEVYSIIGRIWKKLETDIVVRNNTDETMWLSWMLDGFCAAATMIPGDNLLLERVLLYYWHLIYPRKKIK